MPGRVPHCEGAIALLFWFCVCVCVLRRRKRRGDGEGGVGYIIIFYPSIWNTHNVFVRCFAFVESNDLVRWKYNCRISIRGAQVTPFTIPCYLQCNNKITIYLFGNDKAGMSGHGIKLRIFYSQNKNQVLLLTVVVSVEISFLRLFFSYFIIALSCNSCANELCELLLAQGTWCLHVYISKRKQFETHHLPVNAFMYCTHIHNIHNIHICICICVRARALFLVPFY